MLLAIALPVLLWSIFRFTMPAGPYNMDPCGKGTFFAHLITYGIFGLTQVTLGIFGATWGYEYGAKGASGILLVAALCAFLFIGFLIFFYERFMAAYYSPAMVRKSNYTLNRYALVLALGVSSVLLLIAGVASMAMELR